MNLLNKYNKPTPRYTSYPTVPYWEETPTVAAWRSLVTRRFSSTNSANGISLYIHLPFCESLCTYCACNTRITVNHKVEEPYINAVLAEWSIYVALMNERPRIRELHLGGGTPTFFRAENLRKLINGVLEKADVCSNPKFCFEGHPSNTTREHLSTLYDVGFRRASFGIQDFDPVVQDAINRYQSFEEVETVTHLARDIGYESVNFDLVYGLPHQQLGGLEATIRKVLRLRPDRIAFYSYAHVPWMKPGQRKFTEKDLPVDAEKRILYEVARSFFRNAGYRDVGMDHFALPSDCLLQAQREGKLHRNFMGYTNAYSDLLIGLGVSAISDTWNGFSQNVKVVEQYQEIVARGELPVFKGHVLTQEDVILRRHILDLMCRNETAWEPATATDAEFEAIERCRELESDGLVRLEQGRITVTEKGRLFLRTICLCFDARYWRKVPGSAVFSTVA